MSPQPRGVVPPEHAKAMLDARDRAAAAEEIYRATVAAALMAGGSIREVAAVTGLSTNTVQAWGRAGGWPSSEQQAARAAERTRNAEWRNKMGQEPS